MTGQAARPYDVLQVHRAAILAPLLLALALGSTSCSNQAHVAETADTVPPSLSTAGAEWDRLFNSGDAAGLAALYAEDVISMPFNAPTLHGRQALQADFERFFSQNISRHETLVDEILATDDWAIERARYILTYSPRSGGREAKETGRHVVCRKVRKGVWQIAWELWNTDAAQPP